MVARTNPDLGQVQRLESRSDGGLPDGADLPGGWMAGACVIHALVALCLPATGSVDGTAAGFCATALPSSVVPRLSLRGAFSPSAVRLLLGR